LEKLMLNRITFDLGVIESATTIVRRLSDFNGYFIDQDSFTSMAGDNPIIYTLSSVESSQGEGQLHYGFGTVMPGKIGSEYFFTRGHLHTWRIAAEIYMGLSGEGYLLLEHENGSYKLNPLSPGQIIYVPGFTAHRTINTGMEPLTYLGVYPAQAGHDYATIKSTNFRHVVVEINGQPQLIDRKVYLSNHFRATKPSMMEAQ
jgi:glucose-6-phosphate isomerase, archaeal